MLTIRDVTKTFNARTLFSAASMTINYGERVALVGPNGAGKSTLFSLILKTDTPDAGEVIRDEWTTVGFLPQESEPVGDESVMNVATGKAGEIQALEKILRDFEATGDVSSPEYFEAHAKHDALQDPQTEAKAKRILKGLGFKESDFTRPAREFSGGWVMRAHMTRLLVMEPDLLLLDEPTNHLDLLSLMWFRNYLKNYPGALLIISHDRDFMDELVQSVYEIEESRLIAYQGNYSDYLKQREENWERANQAFKNQQKEIEQIQDFIDRFRSVASKASQAQSREKQLAKMDKLEKPRPLRKGFRFNFPQPQRSGQRLIALTDIHQAYGTKQVYTGLDLEVERGERTVLVGPNGAGKSTLIKILAGEVPFQKGERKLGTNVKLGYFSQHRADTLDPDCSVLEELKRVAPELREDEARSVLGSFLFKREDVHKKCRVLSGGEKSRVNLVKFLVDPPNLLLMDEPTTHLDIWAIEGLILALQKFEGTLVFISHDVHFIRSLATKVLHITEGKVTAYSGDYDYYLQKTGAEENARAAVIAG
ncbi:MAG: ABC-F family ATP-binding cassette domain-containing protein [Verrucomicrobiota bacterium]|jgi:ATP-binding cassette subfamily F protein 3|nr:ABC-F family ATP-binding cassette domain-containing protein [Verrucomicrobiota bacterium]